MEHIKIVSEKTAEIQENPDFLTTQIITYLGNKRALIGKIEEEIRIILQTLNKEKLFCADIFSGSGIVARMMKKYSSHLIANDLEQYSALINSCYLSNKKDFPKEKCAELRQEIQSRCEKELFSGIISQNYAPKNDHNIQKGERVFYTHENPEGNIVFNEVNTIPGFTEHSRFPGMMRGAGQEFAALVEKLIEGTVTAACACT